MVGFVFRASNEQEEINTMKESVVCVDDVFSYFLFFFVKEMLITRNGNADRINTILNIHSAFEASIGV